MKPFITRAYNSFKIQDNGILVKESPNEKLRDEISYYESLSELDYTKQIWFPRFISSSNDGGMYRMALEYYGYGNLGNLMFSSATKDTWERVVKMMNVSLSEFNMTNESSVTDGIFRIYRSKMYIDKTEKYYKELADDSKFDKLTKPSSLYINGGAYRNFNSIWLDIKDLINTNILDATETSSTMIHGDFCFSNILCGVSPMNGDVLLKYIDPRGSFGKRGIYGDQLYDYAKLRHSYEGKYEYIIYDKFSFNEYSFNNGSPIEFGFEHNNTHMIADVFEKHMPLISDWRVKLLEGLIFIGMCSRHYDSFNRQVVMYSTGIRLLNEVMNEI